MQVDTNKIETLIDKANEVRNATIPGENSAVRVGELFSQIINYDAAQTTAINTHEVSINNLREDVNTILESGGGGSGTAGQQRTYFLNIAHGTEPLLPEPGDYDGVLADTFTKNGYTWTYTNTNPNAGEDTYQMWAWFQGEIPMSTSGPVRIYNSANGGSNGEDGNEIEFIYKVVPVKPSAQTLLDWTTDLAAAMGSALDKNNNPYTQADAVPSGWTDRATGIDSTNKYEYRSFRKSSINENTGKREWGLTGFSTPVLISNWGEKGEDGDGVEYIFYAIPEGGVAPTAGNNPHSWANTGEADALKDRNGYLPQHDEYLGPTSGSLWTDEATDLSSAGYGEGSVQYVSIRKKKNDVWQLFSEPKVWSRLGKDGVVSGYTVDIYNDNMPIGTDASGHVGAYSNQAFVQVFHNSTPLTCVTTTPTGNQFSYTIGTIIRSDTSATISSQEMTATPNSNNPSQIDVNVTGIQNFTGVSAIIPITITLPDSAGTRNRNIHLYGLAGIPGTFIDLYLSCRAIRTDYNMTTATPAAIQLGVTIGNGDTLNTYYSAQGATAGSAEALGYNFKYHYDNDSPVTHTGGNLVLSNFANKSTLTITLEKNGSFIDEETISFVRDGEQGSTGKGVTSITPYYRAVQDATNPNATANDINTSDSTTVPSNWNASNPYLYRRELTTYTSQETSWGVTTLYQVWRGQGERGADGYSLIVNPEYAIFEEPLVRDDTNPNNVVYSVGTLNVSNWSANVQVVKGKEPQVIACRNFSFVDSTTSNSMGILKTDTYSADGKTFILSINSITNSSAIEGIISFTVTVYGDNAPFALVKIPVYINRAGKITRYIMGDTETKIMSKTIFTTTAEEVVTFNNLGTYMQSSEQSISNLSLAINGITANTSLVKQTADAISLGVQNGWYNYVTNPLAVNGTIGTVTTKKYVCTDGSETEVLYGRDIVFYVGGDLYDIANGFYTVTNGTISISGTTVTVDGFPWSSGTITITDETSANRSIIKDNTFGEVLQLTHTVPLTNRSWQLRHTLDAKYGELTNKTVTWFCIVKGNNDIEGSLCFGSGPFSEIITEQGGIVHADGNQYKALIIEDDTSELHVSMGLQNPVEGGTTYYYYDLSTEKCGIKKLNDNWSLCWASVKLGTEGVNRSIIPTQNRNTYTLGFNSMQGTWKIYYCGIVMGQGYPSIDMIMQGAGLKKAGINLNNGKITSIGDQFEWKNNNDETILGINENGDAEFAGTVKSKNFYHSVCINNSYNVGYCTPTFISEYSDRSWISNFTAGKYYTEEQLSVLSETEITLNDPNIIACTGSADIVLIPTSYNVANPVTVMLPAPNDYEGKLIEVIDGRYSQGGTLGAISVTNVGSTSLGNYFGRGFHQDGTVNSLQNSTYSMVNKLCRFYSVKNVLGDNKYYWVLFE